MGNSHGSPHGSALAQMTANELDMGEDTNSASDTTDDWNRVDEYSDRQTDLRMDVHELMQKLAHPQKAITSVIFAAKKRFNQVMSADVSFDVQRA